MATSPFTTSASGPTLGTPTYVTPSRRVLVARHRRLPLHLVAMKHMGSAGPPKPAETDALRHALGPLLG